MEAVLLPDTDTLEQRVLILGGAGGVGKTQLAIAYSKQYRALYDSIFWLNAKSEMTLKGSLRLLARRILAASIEGGCNDDEIQIHVSTWLSEQNNTCWLLIFDNHDEPQRYDISKCFPCVSHGSIIITTRLPELVNGEKIKVRPKAKGDESLRILETRSGRENVEPGKPLFVLSL